MMRPMKLAGDQLMFGAGCLEHLKTVICKKAFIVIGGGSLVRNKTVPRIEAYLKENCEETMVFSGVEADPSMETVRRGSAAMVEFEPDLIIAAGGGSVMDAAKMMWVFYEHPEFHDLGEILKAVPFPKLRKKAKLVCIPSTAGSASEVSRSVVITDNGRKQGIGNMEMMPDIALCDPCLTVSLPPRITAETGMDALTHALEALVSARANCIADTLAERAAAMINEFLPRAYENGEDMEAREAMMNASMMAGLAFTNVSLGIVHSMAHTVGGHFHVSHGLADAVILPWVIAFNSRNSGRAASIYGSLAQKLQVKDLEQAVRELNCRLGIPGQLKEVIHNEKAFMAELSEMVQEALKDGCTKTNPVIPDSAQMEKLFINAYYGRGE